ncbi:MULTISPECIES: hypothetical protein [unclassified Streptomyces]|uniref:hypothetical protein n=1 Tax=unclassified Streptomyces TaxID=2593676 RepID=UPI0036E5F1B9
MSASTVRRRPFQWRFTTSDLDDLLARLDRHTADHHEGSSVALCCYKRLVRLTA